MVKLSLATSGKKLKTPYSTIVVVVRKKGKKTEAVGADADLAERINAAEEDGISFNDFKKGVFFRGVLGGNYRNALVVGLDERKIDLETLRKFAATIHQNLKAQKVESAAIPFESLMAGFKNADEVARAFTEGLLLAAYEFKKYKTKAKKEGEAETELGRFEFILGKKALESKVNAGIRAGTQMAECINFTRDLGNTPGNLMTPKILADSAVAAAKGTKLRVTVWDKARIKKEGFGGLYSVSLGSAADPRFIILEYKNGKKSDKPVCFVGKGLTFDSGGISIKPSGGMEEMKFDKGGGIAVIGTMLAIAKLGLKVNAIGLVPATENMPGPLANKPGDIIVARNGKTVEVDNTDAEGRLILMDALAYASELKPAAIFDAATLTGAMVVALGNSYTGYFTRDEKLRKQIDEAAKVSGEAVWAMPINDHHVGDMKGTYADLNNISSFKGAGSSTAAAFLEQFVDKEIPWAHFDIAGTAWHVGNRLNYCPRKGASGVMVRTFVELAKIFG